MSSPTLNIIASSAMVLLNKFTSFVRDDRVLMVSIGIGSYSFIRGLIMGLELVRDSNVVPPAEPKTRYITQDTEDALEHRTLDKLLKHPSFAVREVAVKILCERTINNKDAMTHLLVGITRKAYDDRMKSLRALALLTGHTTGFEGLIKLDSAKGYTALVRSLELSLDDAEQFLLNDPKWDEYYLRDMTERFCLMFILELTNKFDVGGLIKAGFVEKWLSKQLWGETPEERLKNFGQYMSLKDNRIVSIVNNIRLSKRGRKALVEAGLEAPGTAEEEKGNLGPSTSREPRRQSEAQEEETLHHVRTREQSEEEQRLRRQHREAMVLNDGTRPFGRDDIIEPDHESAD